MPAGKGDRIPRSSGTPGEGRGGGGLERRTQNEFLVLNPPFFVLHFQIGPHPNPPPEYRRRGPESASTGLAGAVAGAVAGLLAGCVAGLTADRSSGNTN